MYGFLGVGLLPPAPSQRGSGKLISPETPRKQRNQREKFHPAEEHEEHQQPLGGQREDDIRAAWSHLPETCADIAQRGYRSA